MGYPIFGKVKTVVLPCWNVDDFDHLSNEQYKEKYGIDLEEIFELQEVGVPAIKTSGFILIADGGYNGLNKGLLSVITTISVSSTAGHTTMRISNACNDFYTFNIVFNETTYKIDDVYVSEN